MTQPHSRSVVTARLDEWVSTLFDLGVVWVSTGVGSVITQLDAHERERARAWRRVEHSLKALANKLAR